MAKSVAKSASRALGSLICKDKALGGMPFECFTECYNSLVQPVFDYGSSIWGTHGYSCVETVQYRACSYFLGHGKYAPTLAVICNSLLRLKTKTDFLIKVLLITLILLQKKRANRLTHFDI